MIAARWPSAVQLKKDLESPLRGEALVIGPVCFIALRKRMGDRDDFLDHALRSFMNAAAVLLWGLPD